MSCDLRVRGTPWENILSVQPGYMAGVAHLYLRLYYQGTWWGASHLYLRLYCHKKLLEGWSFELCLKRQEDLDHMTSVSLPRCAGRHEPIDTDILALQWFLPPGSTFGHIFP